MYEQGIINEQEKNELDSILDDRGRSGWLHIDIFSDGAIDVHIPGWMVVVGGVVSAGAIAAALSSIVPAAFVASAEQIVSLLYSKEISEVVEHGIVVYMTKTSNNLICAGGNCYYGDKFFFHHVRLDT